MSKTRLYKQLFTLNGGQNFFTTISAASNNLNLPQSTINVASTAGFPTSGTLYILSLVNSSYTYQNVSYSGVTGTSFTGCTGGTGTIFTSYTVSSSGSLADGTWLCPAGVKFIIVSGCGGGGGGGGGASSGGRSNTNFAAGGSGGWASPTITQIVQVTPGVIYNISIGDGGASGTYNCVANIVSGGGSRPGNPGFDGASSIFGGVIFPGGKGGREGQLISINTLTFALGSDCANTALSGTANPTPQTIQMAAQQPAFTTSGTSQGAAHAVNRASNQYSLSGGGTAGGVSNNYSSTSGYGGQGAQGFDGYPFSTYGGSGTYGGGGGGGGGGENWDYNNTHDGSVGGFGGSGFIEISWMA